MLSPNRKRVRKVSIGTREVFTHGLAGGGLGDFFYIAMSVSWAAFLSATIGVFILINVLFALLYNAGSAPVANVGPGDVIQLFYFSIETLATVGYGDMHPQTNYGHVVASVESFVGLFLTAALTGLIFSRLSRPQARFIFGRNLAIGHHDGQPMIVGRVANARSNLISGATAKLWLIRNRVNAEGVQFRGFEELQLLRAENPVFTLSWSLFHPLDERSPIGGLDQDGLAACDATFLLTVTGQDESAAQTVYARHTYDLENVRWNHRHADILSVDAVGHTHIDYTRFHDVIPVSPQPASASNPS